MVVATALGHRVGPLPLLTAGALYIAAAVLMRGIVTPRPPEAG